MFGIVDRIEDLNKRDQEKLKLEKAQNELEAYIIDGQDKLYQEVIFNYLILI